MIKGLPEKLRNLRARYRYSQKQVAEKLGVSPSIVSGYETGERTPSTEILLALSYIYNCSTDYLLGKMINSPQTPIDVTELTSNQINAIINFIDSMKE
ncbi:MAG: helix-turn-helix domain-containing protein [Faecalibacterium sp.]|nr:helix-turn-helix domain-containing protein [Ruminococcus sp.]MCM1392457.1 helix-turn-helix domain-containing protein [Ruminococcus sp.]MCM1486170.1 helix-turn-helix domain-containing protein [Faecalibacterium sp.]